MALVTLGLSHHNTPLEVRSRLAFADADLADALVRLRGLPGVAETAIVSTCNRTEILARVDAEDEARIIEWWRREREAPAGEIEQYLYTHRDLGAVQHSLRVAAGLDSMILGEAQILGQMKLAFRKAVEVGSLGPVLSRLFQHSFAVAKLVRSSTEIGAHPVTVAYAAVQMARRIFADFRSATAVMVGAGEIGTLIARHLQGQGIGRLIVVNRSLERAERLARDVGGYAVSLNDLATYLPDADILISSTGARGHVLERETMERAVASRRRKPVFMIDLAVPRDIDPRIAAMEDVYLYTVDDLRSVIAENLKNRGQAARQAEALVEEHARGFAHWMETRDAAATIRALRTKAREYRDEVLDKARAKLAAGAAPDEVLAFLADTLANKLLHAPSSRLREADAVEQALLLSSVQKLFDLPEK